jgi:hypothetical protein
MKKIILALCVTLLLTACGNTDYEESNNDANYNALNKTILDNENYLEQSDYFDVSIMTNKLDDDTYRYYLIIDNSQIAMYDVVAMACDVKTINVDSQIMCPNIGVYEDTQYKMIPNQTNKDENFIKGLSLSGISETEDITLNMVITWTNQNSTKKFKDFITISYPLVDSTIIDEENVDE